MFQQPLWEREQGDVEGSSRRLRTKLENQKHLKAELLKAKLLGQVAQADYLQFALHERLVDHHLGSDISEFTSLPDLYLLAHGLEVPLHSIHSH